MKIQKMFEKDLTVDIICLALNIIERDQIRSRQNGHRWTSSSSSQGSDRGSINDIKRILKSLFKKNLPIESIDIKPVKSDEVDEKNPNGLYYEDHEMNKFIGSIELANLDTNRCRQLLSTFCFSSEFNGVWLSLDSSSFEIIFPTEYAARHRSLPNYSVLVQWLTSVISCPIIRVIIYLQIA